MWFVDWGLAVPEVVTIQQMKAEWEVMHVEDPENFGKDFGEFLLEVILATINGRNDMEIAGMTPAEIERFINGLRRRIYGTEKH